MGTIAVFLLGPFPVGFGSRASGARVAEGAWARFRSHSVGRELHASSRAWGGIRRCLAWEGGIGQSASLTSPSRH